MRILSVGIGVGALMVSTVAFGAATRVQVVVRNQSNSVPIGDVMVCLFSAATGSQIGFGITTGQGTATFNNVTAGDWVVKAWKANHQVAQTTLLVNENTQPAISRVVLLTPGAGTNPCSVPITAYPMLTATFLYTVNSFSIGLNNPASIATGSNVILIANFPPGFSPTHWRTSEVSKEALQSAVWRSYVVDAPGSIPYGQFSTTGRRTIWFEAKAVTATGETRSNIVQDSVDVHIEADYVVSDIAGLAAHIKANGFTVSGTAVSAPQCPAGAVHDTDLVSYVYQAEPQVLTSELRWFAQGTMRTGWRVKAMGVTKDSGWDKVTGESTVRAVKVHTSPADPRFNMVMRLVPYPVTGNTQTCPMVRARISDVTLVGPAGRNWREAFTR